MPFFYERPHKYEARQFLANEVSVTDIRGWLQTGGATDIVVSDNPPVSGEEAVMELSFINASGSSENIISGQWLLKTETGEFVTMDASQLYTRYEQVQY